MRTRLLRWLIRRFRLWEHLTPEQVAGAHNRFIYSAKVDWWVNRAWMHPYLKALEGDRIPEAGLTETRILDRRFMLKECAEAVRRFPVSTAECGVYKGVGSAIICAALDKTYTSGEYHFAFDSFEGLPAPAAADSDGTGTVHWKPNDLAVPEGSASTALSGFPFCRLVKGWIPGSLAVAAGHRFRLVHIDVDLYETTREALEFFYPRIVRGGVILCDDYGMISCPGARKAMDEFFADKPEAVIEVTCGSGLVVVTNSAAEGSG
jgi:O-methyltransferase